MSRAVRIPAAARALAVALGLSAGLGGCVIVISDDGIQAGTEAGWEANRRQDGALADRVRDALRAEPELRDLELSVVAHDGVITLRGAVEGVPALDRAVRVARATEGVEKVVSRLKVEVR